MNSRLHTTALPGLVDQFALIAGYRLATHPALSTWLVIDPEGYLILCDEHCKPFVTSLQATVYVNRHKRPRNPLETRPITPVHAFDRAFVGGK